MSDGFEWRSNEAHHAAQAKMGALDAYYAWTLATFAPYLQGTVVDAGAGVGHAAAQLLRNDHDVLLLEGGEENLAVLRERFAGHPRAQVVASDLTDNSRDLAGRDIGCIVSLDVLEHLPDDVSALRQFLDALPRGGHALIKVPALPWLYGPVDEASGHYRRYTRDTLRKALQAAGFEVRMCRYMNLAAVPSYFLKSRILKRRENFSHTFSEAQVRRINRLIPWLRRIDTLTGPPIGLSVVAAGRKP